MVPPSVGDQFAVPNPSADDQDPAFVLKLSLITTVFPCWPQDSTREPLLARKSSERRAGARVLRNFTMAI